MLAVSTVAATSPNQQSPQHSRRHKTVHLPNMCMMLITVHTGESVCRCNGLLLVCGKVGRSQLISDLGNLQGILPRQCPQIVPPPDMSLLLLFSTRLCMCCTNMQEQLACNSQIVHAAYV